MKNLKCTSLSVFFAVVFYFSGSVKIEAKELSIVSSPSATLRDQLTVIAAPNVPMKLTVSPVTINIEVNPGQVKKTEIKIRNNSTAAEELSIHLGTFTADRDGEKPMLRDPQPTDEFMNWLHVDQAPFVVHPGEWKTIPIEFAPPASASFSYYYTVIIQRSKEQVVKGGDTMVSGAPAVLVLTTVRSPNVRRELQLSRFSARFPLVEFLPEHFELDIGNTGNVHIIPTGNIFIDGQGKKDLLVLSINPGNSAILPQTNRIFSVSWDDGFPSFAKVIRDEKDQKTDNGKQLYQLKWDFEKINHLRFGKYTAHLILVYDNGERDVPIESSVIFWVIPFRFILAVIAIPTFPMIVVYLIMRRRLNQVQHERI